MPGELTGIKLRQGMSGSRGWAAKTLVAYWPSSFSTLEQLRRKPAESFNCALRAGFQGLGSLSVC